MNKNLKLTQKASKDAVEKKVWTLTDFNTVADLQTHVADTDVRVEAECFWTGFKLVTRAKDGFEKALDKLGIKYTVATEAVQRSKETDQEVLARLLNMDVTAITDDLITKFKGLAGM